MKIVVLSGQILKQEMESKQSAAGIEFIWIEDIKEAVKCNADAYFDLDFMVGSNRISLLKQLLPKPVFINSVINSLAETNPSFIRINAWPTFLKRKICETAVANEKQKINAINIFDALGWTYQFVPDVKGMVSARIVAMIINEAYYTLEAGVSTKTEIDIAMKLGTNYPFGPFEWAEKIGLKNICRLLVELSETDKRYLVSPALFEEAGRA
jgi:3-hydroxybutyryl-CoA dehydrogenase